MRKHYSRFVSMFLAVLVALSMVIVDTGTASAKSSWDVFLNNYAFVGQREGVYAGNTNGDDATVTSVKSSNSKVIKVIKSKYDGTTYYDLKYKKAGKAKVTVKFKTPSGKVIKKTKTIKVKKYPNHIKSITINGKSVSVKKHKYEYEKKFTGTKAAIKFKAQNGWKISYADISMYDQDADKDVTVKSAKTKVKKGKSISFPKEYDFMNIWVEMTKGDKYITYQMTLYRD